MQLAYFGKLSSRGDFVRHNGSTPAVRSLDAWLQNGLRALSQRTGGGLEGAFDNGGTSGFVLRHLDAPGPVVGTIRPSRDASGRTYPFFVLLQLDGAGAGPASSIHMAREYSSFFASSVRAVDAAVSGEMDTSDLDNWIRENAGRFTSGSMPAPNGDARFDSIPFSAMCERLWGSFESDRKLAVFHNLWSVFAPLGDPNRPMPGYGVQIPLANEELLIPSVAFWLSVCDRLMKRPGQAPSLIWNLQRARNGTPPLLYVNFSKLPSSAMAHILQVDLDLEDVFRTDLLRGRDAADIRSGMDASILRLVDDDRLTLREFVDAIA